MAAPPGATFQDCREGSSDCPVMVVIPEGTFLMGSTEGDTNAYFDQFPQRRIEVMRFAVSRAEVTFADWQACVRSFGCDGRVPDRNGWEGDNRPLIEVSWHEAQSYVAWLSLVTGRDYRLLTEAEWEYAARGVTSADDPRNGESWSFGDDESQLSDYAWLNWNSNGQTQPIESRRANPFGLYDMHGNVWEWVEDCYAPYDPTRLDAAAVETDAETLVLFSGDSTCLYRVLRGGSWYDYGESLRSALRSESDPNHAASHIGFRVARSL
jgi:formylglycine-generating enzyme required for sulfatase activity